MYSKRKKKEKKKDLKVYVSNFETYTKYFGIADKKHKSKIP